MKGLTEEECLSAVEFLLKEAEEGIENKNYQLAVDSCSKLIPLVNDLLGDNRFRFSQEQEDLLTGFGAEAKVLWEVFLRPLAGLPEQADVPAV